MTMPEISNKRYCLECGKAFITDGKAGRRIYCSDTCKKRRYYALHPEKRNHKAAR